MFGNLYANASEDEDADGTQKTADVFLGSRAPKPPDSRAECGFVGLENQGATCYLNSLIQALYMTPELRQGLFAIDPIELGVLHLEDYEREKAALAESGVVEADESLIHPLVEMGFDEALSKAALVATKNASFEVVTEYIATHEEALRKKITADAKDIQKRKKTTKPRLIPLELQKLFASMNCVDIRALSTEELTRKGFQWQGADGHVQHDAHELNRLLIDALSKSLPKSKMGGRLCENLYQGLLVNQTRCLSCNNASERQEFFYDILLQVKGFPDFITSLRDYTAAETLTGSNKYECNSASCVLSKQDAHRAVCLRSFPPVLTFSLQRFDIDRTTWQRVKVVSKFEFPLIIDMNKFASKADGSVALPKLEGEEENRYLQHLREGSVWIDQVYTTAREISEDLVRRYGVDAWDRLNTESQEKQEIKAKLRCTSESISECPRQSYELFAIIMHRGTAYSGHYFAYIRDTLREGKWAFPVGKKGSKSESEAASTDEKQFFYLTEVGALSKTLFVREGSPLGIIVTVFEKQAAKTLGLQALGTFIKKTTGNTWNRSANGALGDFLKKHSDIFIYGESGAAITLKGHMKIEVLPQDRFVEMLAIHDEQSRPPQRDSICLAAAEDNISMETEMSSIDMNLVEELVENLVNESYGCFYEFNDSDVKPMTLSDTKKAFEGRDSAYLVVYRKCSTTNSSSESESGACDEIEIVENIEGIVQHSMYSDRPPEFWLEKVKEMNEKLATDRELFRTHGGGKLELNILFPVHLDSRKPPLFPKVSEEFIPSYVPEKYRPGVKMEITFDMSVNDLCSKFTKHSVKDDNVGANGVSVLRGDASLPVENTVFDCDCNIFGLNSTESWVFSRLNKYEDGYYILPPLDAAAKVGDAIKGQDVEVRSSGGKPTNLLLAWNGKNINEATIDSTGKDGLPVKLSVTLLSEDKSKKAIENIGFIWLRKSTAILDAVKAIQSYIQECFGDSFKKSLDIGLIDKRQKSRGHDNGLYLVHLYVNGGVMRDKVLLTNGLEKKLCAATIGDFTCDGILVEACGKGRTLGLSELEVQARNKALTVTIQCDFDLEKLKKICTFVSVDLDTTCDYTQVLETPQSFSISSDMIVHDVILNAAKIFKVPDEVTDFLKINIEGNIPLNKIGQAVSTAGINDGTLLYIELDIPVPEQSSVLIKVCRLRGNDPLSSKVNLQEPGTRSSTVLSASIELTESVSSMKLLFIKLLRELDNSEENEVDPQTVRFRMTNFSPAQEATNNLVYEKELKKAVPTSGAPAIVESLVSSISGITNDILLLLEDGAPPVKGVKTLRIKFWKPSIAYTTAESPLQTLSFGDVEVDSIGNITYKGQRLNEVNSETLRELIRVYKVKSGRTKNDMVVHLTNYFTEQSLLKRSMTGVSDAGCASLLPITGEIVMSESKGRSNGDSQNTLKRAKADDESSFSFVSEVATAPDIKIAANESDNYVVDVGSLAVGEDCSIRDFYSAVHQLLSNCQGISSSSIVDGIFERKLSEEFLRYSDCCGFKVPESIEGFVLRELRSNNLPGKTLPLPAVSVSKPKGKIEENAAVVKQASLVDKSEKLKIQGGKSVIFELSPGPDNFSPGAIKLWLHRLVNPDPYCKDEGKSEMSQPPVQIVVNGGLAPTLGHLKEAIKSALGIDLGTPNENIRVFKFVESKIRWTELNMAAQKGGAGKSKSSNIRQPPFSINEGDLLCAFDMRTLSPPNAAASDLGEVQMIVDRPEDYENRKRSLERKDFGGKKQDRKKRIVEVALRIGGDVDFSSSSETDEENGP